MNQKYETPQKVLLRNTASFVDWSPGLYVRSSTNGLNGSSHIFAASPRSARSFTSYNNRLLARYGVPSAQSGRMFWTKKGTNTTKGEMSIIDGICQNRSEELRGKQRGLPVFARSHTDAWKTTQSLDVDNLRTPRTQRSMDSGGISAREMENWTLGPVRKEYMHLNDEHSFPFSIQHFCNCFENKNEHLPQLEAIPKSNIQTHSIPTNKATRIPPIRKRKGVSYVKKYKQKSDTNPDVIYEKTVMDIYLPNMDQDDASSVNTPVPTLKYTTRQNERPQSVDVSGKPIHPFQAQGVQPPAVPFNSPTVSRAQSPEPVD